MQLKYGIISDVKPGYAKVFFAENGIDTDWLPVLKSKAMNDVSSWPLEVKEQVAVLCDERCEEGVVLGAIHNNEDAPDAGEAKGKWRHKFGDGALLEYDKNTHKYTMESDSESLGKILDKMLDLMNTIYAPKDAPGIAALKLKVAKFIKTT